MWANRFWRVQYTKTIRLIYSYYIRLKAIPLLITHSTNIIYLTLKWLVVLVCVYSWNQDYSCYLISIMSSFSIQTQVGIYVYGSKMLNSNRILLSWRKKKRRDKKKLSFLNDRDHWLTTTMTATANMSRQHIYIFVHRTCFVNLRRN